MARNVMEDDAFEGIEAFLGKRPRLLVIIGVVMPEWVVALTLECRLRRAINVKVSIQDLAGGPIWPLLIWSSSRNDFWRLSCSQLRR